MPQQSIPRRCSCVEVLIVVTLSQGPYLGGSPGSPDRVQESGVGKMQGIGIERSIAMSRWTIKTIEMPVGIGG